MIKNVNRKWQPKLSAIKDENGKTLMNKLDIVERWTHYCSSLYQAKMDQKIKAQVIEELQEVSPPNEEEEETEDYVLETEVRRAILRLKSNKSAGHDEVVAEMLKHGGEQVIQEMHKICNAAWEKGQTPEEWKKSILINVHKKGSPADCNNYRTISLISTMSKIMMMILTERLKPWLEENVSEEQAGFRKDRSTVQQILSLRLMAEKARRKNKKIYSCFVDFKKAFDCIDQDITWAVLQSYGVNKKLIRLLKEINSNAQAAVRICGEYGTWFDTSRGTRQGDPISPCLFVMHLERALDKIKEEKGISVNGTNTNYLCFADDIVLLEENEEKLENTLKILINEGSKYGLSINLDKTKAMVFGEKETSKKITVEGAQLENVQNFTYLGTIMSQDLNCKHEITCRIAKALSILKSMDKIWKSKSIKLSTKLNVLKTCVFSSMLYGCETWVLTKEYEKKILAFERKCYRKILRICWTQKVSNENLYRRIQVKENLMQNIIQRKLRLFGHICHMNNDRRIKTLMFRMIEGKNKKGRPNREWIDDVVKWCGRTVKELYHAALDKQHWNNIVNMAKVTYGHCAHGC